MKAMFLATALALSSLAAAAQAETPSPAQVAGDWRGAVNVGDRSLPIVIHLGAAVSGDSPAENRFGIPGKLETTAAGYRVSFESGGVFEGALKNGKLEGAYSKDDLSVPVVLERAAAADRPK